MASVSCSDTNPQAGTNERYRIVLGCLTTVILCAWVSMHPNTHHRLAGSWARAGQKARLLLFAVIAPEIICGWAWMERRAAKIIKRDFKNLGYDISMSHAHLIAMCGFALCFPEKKVREALSLDRVEAPTGQVTTTNEANTSPVRTDEDQDKSADIVQEPSSTDSETVSIADDEHIKLRYITTLSAGRFKELLRTTKPSIKFPLITKSEIADRSKRSGLAKTITALHVLWFVTHSISRSVNYAITKLEVTTFSLACLNMYLVWLWRDKPHDVQVQIPVYLLEDSEEWTTMKEEWETRKAKWCRRREQLKAKKKKRRPAALQCLLFFPSVLVWLWRIFWSTMKNLKRFLHAFLWLPRRKQESKQINGVKNDDLEGEQSASGITARDIPAASWKLIGHIPIWLARPMCHMTFGWWSSVDTSCLVFLAGVSVTILLLPLLSIVVVVLTINLYLMVLGPTLILLLLLRSSRVRKLFDAYLLHQRDGLVAKGDFRQFVRQVAIIGTFAGGLHFWGWDFHHLRKREEVLWGAMTLASTVIPNISALYAVTISTLSVNGDSSQVHAQQKCRTALFAIIFIATILIYLLARLFIIALVIIQLLNIGSTSYVYRTLSWTDLLPFGSKI